MWFHFYRFSQDSIDGADYRKDLGRGVYFQLNGKIVDIREWYPLLKQGEMKASERGVSMPVLRYARLYYSLEQLSKALGEVCQSKDVQLKVHLGANMYASVQAPYRCVNLRQWYKDAQGVLRPGKGVALKISVWDKFLSINEDMHKRISELEDAVPCELQDDHITQMGRMRCAECNPDIYKEWEA